MQCNVSLLYGKNIEEKSFFSLLQCKEKIFFCFLCAFSTMQPFFFLPCTFAMMQTCYMQEEKEAHLLLLFATTQKKNLFFLLHFFGFFLATIFHLFVACNRLVTWNKKKKHTHPSFSCYNISYIFILFCISFQLLCFFGCNAS